MSKLKCFAIDREDANRLFSKRSSLKETSLYSRINSLLTVVEVDNFDKRTLAEVKVSVALLTVQGNEILQFWRPDSDKCSILLDISYFYAEIVEKEEIVNQFYDHSDEPTDKQEPKSLKDIPNAMRVISDKTNLFLFAANLSSSLIANYGDVEDRFQIKTASSLLSNERTRVVIFRKGEGYFNHDLTEPFHVVVLYAVRKELVYPEYFFKEVGWQNIDVAAAHAKANRDKYTDDTLTFLTTSF